MAKSNALFELTTDAQTYRGGDVVSGRAVALDTARRPVVVELVFNDQSGVGVTAAAMSFDGAREGDVMNFEFDLPDDAHSGYESPRARLGWAVQARFAHAKLMRQRDLLFLDVVNSPRSPAPDSQPLDMARGHETVGFMGRGKRTEKWDVSARLLTPEVVRGASAEIEIDLPSGGVNGRQIEVGVTCVEHWMTVPRGDDNSTNMSELVYERFEPLSLTTSGVASVVIPADVPYSWHRSPLEDKIVNRTAGFTWLAVVREGHPDKGPQKQVELTVLP
jgi:hypothetical protein